MLSCDVTYFVLAYNTVSVDNKTITFEVLAMDIGTAVFLEIVAVLFGRHITSNLILLSFSHITEAHPTARSLWEPFQLKLFDILSLKSEYYDVPWGLFSYESGDNYWHFLIQEFASFVITKCVYYSVVRVAFQFRSDVG